MVSEVLDSCSMQRGAEVDSGESMHLPLPNSTFSDFGLMPAGIFTPQKLANNKTQCCAPHPAESHHCSAATSAV